MGRIIAVDVVIKEATLKAEILLLYRANTE